jgi:serine/threonine protein kinase
LDLQIGFGSFSKVFEGEHRITLVRVAAKVFKRSARRKKIAKEVRLMKACHHPYICQIYEMVYTPKANMIILEL